MQYCRLCEKRKADKTGSHLVPHFIQKTIDNIDKDTGRDKELGFTISQTENISYFGRSILPEKLDDIYGELSKSEIKKVHNPNIVDYLFCSDCEKKFAIIENEYSKSVSQSDSEKNYESNTIPGLAFLFWISILWRISISRKFGLVLKPKESRELLPSFRQRNSNIRLISFPGQLAGERKLSGPCIHLFRFVIIQGLMRSPGIIKIHIPLDFPV